MSNGVKWWQVVSSGVKWCQQVVSIRFKCLYVSIRVKCFDFEANKVIRHEVNELREGFKNNSSDVKNSIQHNFKIQ